MRVDYRFGLNGIDVPRFSVESTEGPQKLFTLATLVLNVLHEQPRVDLVFHSPNSSDLPKKINRLKEIVESAPEVESLRYTEGRKGELGGIYYQWLSIHATDGSGGG
jgi:hypothetical protein